MKADELQLLIAACEAAAKKAHGPEKLNGTLNEKWLNVGIAIEFPGRGAGSGKDASGEYRKVTTPFGRCRALGSRGGRTRAWVSLSQMRNRYEQLRENEAH